MAMFGSLISTQIRTSLGDYGLGADTMGDTYGVGPSISSIRSLVSAVNKNFKINLEGQNYVHFEVMLSRNVKILDIMASL